MSILIKNGDIVTASERYVADILCENETITRIDRGITPPKGAEVINAEGKFVFPGFIDPHVHIYLPFMGTFSKDDYITGSRAALVGSPPSAACRPRSLPSGMNPRRMFWSMPMRSRPSAASSARRARPRICALVRLP